MGSNVLAVPSFVTGPNDAMVTVDVYSGTSSGIVNSISSLAKQYDVDLIGMLRAGAAAAKLVPIVEGIVNGKLLMNPQAALARLLTASNTLVAAVGGTNLSAAFSTLSEGIQMGFAEAGQIVGSVEATVGGVVSNIVNGGISDIQGLGSMINSFAGANVFMMTDNQALIGMAAGVINQASRYGVSGAFNAMISQITSPYIINGIVQQTMPGLLSASDINSLSQIARAVGTGGIKNINPSFCLNFTQSYVRSASGNAQQATPSADYDNYQSILDCYDQANPGWNIADRIGDSSTIDLTSLQSGTDDFNSALAAGVYESAQTDPSVAPTDTTTPFYGLAPAYDAVDPDQQLKDMYPNTYIDPAQRSTQQSVDPMQLQTGAGAAVSAATSSTAVQASPNTVNTNGVLTTNNADGTVTAVVGSQTFTIPAGQQPKRNADGTINTAEFVKEAQDGYNSGAMVFDDQATTQAPNDRVADTPNPVTYKTVGGKKYTTITTGPDRGTYLLTPNDTGVQASSNAINWGQGYWHSDEKYLYQPVDAGTLQPLNN